MTIVCPKCMHKSGDDERVCGKCGAPLLSAAQRRVINVPVGFDPDEISGAPSGSQQTDSSAPTGLHERKVGVGPGKIASNGDSAAAIREVLEHLETSTEYKAKAQPSRTQPGTQPGRTPPGRTGPGRPGAGKAQPKFNRKALFSIVGTVVVIIAVILYFGLKGSPAAPASHSSGPGPTPTTTLLFQFAGSGTSTTGSFTTTGPFKFDYRVACTTTLTKAVSFTLVKDGKKVDFATSGVGNAVESGALDNFGIGGAYAFSVDAPSPCTWTVSGST
jgi:hypothetical protein